MAITYQLIIEIVIALLLISSVLAVIYAARRCAATPLPKSDGSELFAVITASGGAEQLEQTVKGLLLLDDTGDIKSRVVIADCGLDKNARAAAELLARDTERVTVCSPLELPLVLEDNGWTTVRD